MEYRLKKCIVCQREFLQRQAKANPRSKCNRARGLNCITCSKECSKIYNRIAIYIKNKNRNGTR